MGIPLGNVHHDLALHLTGPGHLGLAELDTAVHCIGGDHHVRQIIDAPSVQFAHDVHSLHKAFVDDLLGAEVLEGGADVVLHVLVAHEHNVFGYLLQNRVLGDHLRSYVLWGFLRLHLDIIAAQNPVVVYTL